MRTMLSFAATLLAVATLAACLGPVPGRAQTVSRNPHAHPNGPHQTLPPSRYAVTVNPVAPTVPLAPPPAPVLPAPIVVPTRPVEPQPPPVVAANAIGTVDPIRDGLRVTFGTGETEITPATDAALKHLAKAVPAAATLDVVAYAAGTPDDPSTARRESLSRALEVRSVLIESGIASPRIYVRALGATVPPPPGVSPDRVDVTVTVPPPAPNAGASAQPEKAAP